MAAKEVMQHAYFTTALSIPPKPDHEVRFHDYETDNYRITAHSPGIFRLRHTAAQTPSSNTPGTATSLYRITQPGSYYLTGNVTVATGEAITITADNVTLDLNGHAVRGPVRCLYSASSRSVECDWLVESSPRAGINTVAAPHSVIRNGAVMGFAGIGIQHGEAAVIENLEVSSNAGAGIAGAGHANGGVVRDVLVRHNGGSGIVCSDMTVERSSFAENGGTGVDCQRGAFSDSVSRGNGGFGVADGFKPGLRTINNRQGPVASVAALRETAKAGASR